GDAAEPVWRAGTARGGAESNASGSENRAGRPSVSAGARRSSQPPAVSAEYKSVPSGSGAGLRAPSGSAVRARAIPPPTSRHAYTCGNPDGSATNHSSPRGVHTGSARTERDSTSTTAATGVSAGQRTSAQRPAALRVPAIQRPSGDGTTASHVSAPSPSPSPSPRPGSAGAGTVGRLAPGRNSMATERPAG